MVLLSFKNMLFVVSGPLEARLNNVMNILFVCELYKCDFKILWKKTKSFQLDLSDICMNSFFKGKILTDDTDIKSLVKDDYYYNPKLPINVILANTIALSKNIDNIPTGTLHKMYDWLIIDNLNGKAINMLPDKLVPLDLYKNKIKELYKHLILNSSIDGYYNMFKQMANEKKHIGVYVNEKDDINIYFKHMDKIPNSCSFFIVYADNAFTLDHMNNWTTEFQKRYGRDRCTLVKHREENKKIVNIVNFMCLQECELIILLHTIDNYLREIVNISNNTVYFLEKQKCLNIDILQILI